MINSFSKTRGFTLIEAMVVLAVVAIFASLAVTAFTNQTERARRAEARQFLMDMANRQESFYTQYLSYTEEISGNNGCTGMACGLGLGTDESTTGLYVGEVNALPNGCAPGGATPCSSFTLVATSTVTDTECVTLTYTSANVRGSTGTSSTDDCWR